MKNLRILVDAMGGDNAPACVLEGCVRAKEAYGLKPVLVGEPDAIRACAQTRGIPIEGFEILPATQFVGMNDDPLLVRSLPDTSMRVGLTALARKEADAFVSAGNTGALQMGANLFVRRIAGITRSAIGTILPCTIPALLLDSGANATFSPELLCQYALMGSIYMKKVHGVRAPRVGLLNIGKEPRKGTPDHAAAYKLLCELPDVSFVGNIEPDALIAGDCDVLVADGFAGNILLKTMEGMSVYTLSCAEEALNGALPDGECTKILSGVRRRFDPSEYGGAPILGVAAPVIKAHGNADADAIKNAIRQAAFYAEGGVPDAIDKGLEGVSFSERRREE